MRTQLKLTHKINEQPNKNIPREIIGFRVSIKIKWKP